MAVLDDDFSVGETLAECGARIWSPPGSTPAVAPGDFKSLYERQRARANAAEARCEELRWAEVAARSDAGSWKSRFKSCRRRLSEAEEEAKELRNAARDVPSLRVRVARLEALLAELAAQSSEAATIEALSKEVARLQNALAASPARRGGSGRQSVGEARRARVALEEAPQRRETIKALRKEVTRLSREVGRGNRAIGDFHKKLDKEKERAESIRETAKMLSRENLSLHRENRILGETAVRVRATTDENYWLRLALEGAQFTNKKLTARIAKLRAAGATLTKLSFDEAAHLRNVLRRSRRQKTTIRRLHRENARLRRAVQAARAGREAAEGRLARLRTARKALSEKLSGMDGELRRVLRRSRRQKTAIKSLVGKNARLRRAIRRMRHRIESLEAQLDKLRAAGSVLSKKLYGRKSEQQDKPRSERARGQQPGALGHGRTQRPGLEERREEINPPPDACVCAGCGQPYAPNGAEESSLVEIEVKAYKRVIGRPRWRRTCECASSPMEVSAPAVPRLFVRTPYGISFWARFLFEHCACFRPVRRVAAWFSSHGLAVSPGTLANSRKRFVALFETLHEAILAHQNTTALRHADETSWRVQELRGEERSSRAWLWTSVSADAVCFHIDASRSAEAGLKLFAEALPGTVIVCDRYSAYKRLSRLLGDKVILSFCWSHARRDYIDCAAGQERLTQWCQGWIERVAEIFRLNDTRLNHYDPGLELQTPAFDAAQDDLEKAVERLFADAEAELAALPDTAREGRALRSLVNHREGLCVFVDRPHVPATNNIAERIMRAPAIGRGLSFGSDSEDGAKFTAIMYSVVGTLSMNGIDVLSWLEAWLTASAENGGQPPDDLSPWLPWSMSEERRRELAAPE